MASPTAGFPPIVNPGEPFAYIPPAQAHQLHVWQYVAAATTGMFIWELLLDVPHVFALLVKYRPSLPVVVYLLSRLGTLHYLLLSFIFLVAGGNCVALYVTLGVSWVVGYSCTSLLFFFRVRALYRENNVIVGIFTFLWLCVVAGSVTVPLALGNKAGHILPGESYCIATGSFPAYAGASMIIPAIYDTLVFIAISYRLFPTYEVKQESTWGERFSLFFSGQGLPRLSKAVLQGGQQYYLISVAMNIFTLIFYFDNSLPLADHVMAPLILLAVINSMACRVYREIKFGRITNTTMVQSSTGYNSSRRNGISVPFPGTPRRDGVVVDVSMATTYDRDRTNDGNSTDIGLNSLGFDGDKSSFNKV